MTSYDATAALIIVDVQNDFADPAGSLPVRGGDTIVKRINREIDDAWNAGALIVYTQDWHPPITPHFEKDGGTWPVHCVAETWGAELHPRLRCEGPVVRKGSGSEDGYSGFTTRDAHTGQTTPTALEGLLRSAGARRLAIVGLATDYCVKETALDALRLGFAVEVLREAVRPVELQPGDGDRALEAIRAAGGQVA